MSPHAPDALHYRPAYLAGGVVTAAVFLLYLLTLSPTTAMWDASEYITASYVLGLPHPPGNPLFVLLGHVFGLLPLPVSYAERINLLAALADALAAGLWFLVTERILARWLAQRWQRIIGGTVAAVIGATAFTVWNQSVVSEKVYPVSLLGFALVSWLVMRWCDTADGAKADRLLILIAYLIGLGYANHPAGFLVIPAVAMAVLIRRPAVLRRWRLVLAAVAALTLGVTPFAFEPIRAAYFPALNEGEPTACTRHFAWSCTFDEVTFERLKANIDREQYGKPSVLDRQAPFSAQIGTWWLYFKWQWLRDAYGEHPLLQNVLGALFLVLGLLGAWVHWRRDRQSFWYFGPLIFTLTLALIFYLNFKYGWSQSPELGNAVQREVRDRDYFYIWSFSAWSVWAALGVVWLWESLARLLGARDAGRGARGFELPSRRSWLFATPVLALALIPLFANADQASRAGQTFTSAWAADLLNSVEPYGILITHGDNDTFPLWYAQEVEGIRKDVTVAVTSYLGLDWFVRQLIRRPVREYNPVAGPAIYQGKQWRKPSGPPLKMSFEEADAVPPYIELREPQVFRHGNIVATIQPGILSRDQIMVLRFIRDSFPERPIYFSMGGYGHQLGLGPYLLRQGLAQKLVPTTLTPAPGTIRVPGGWFDVTRTWTLWDGVYQGPRALIREGDWVDRASASIPYWYVATGAVLAEALDRNGKRRAANAVMDTVVQMAKAARLEELLAPAPAGEPVPAGSAAER